MIVDLSPSSFLTKLSARYPTLNTADIERECFSLSEHFSSQADLMRELRIAKAKLSLLTALADLSGEYTLEKVTKTLSNFADYAVRTALNFLLSDAAKRGDMTPTTQEKSGIIILGMGKLGAFELNYSSDIDLIVFFEKDTLTFHGKTGEQKCMNRLAQDLVTILQERTVDGYVFRTDLRLRPDPASTPPAINTLAAMNYYESVGQNWERAAMIKARPIAGDIVAGERFLTGLRPYIWRRSLDFAAINDIHSIKRQMDARGKRDIKLAGHNIKLGLGGIREIEFYAQIHQLIWGGRKSSLRKRGTCETLKQLVVEGLIDEATRHTLDDAYHFHRMVEHRLQMVDDAQTHTLPEDETALANIAKFCGFETVATFEQALLTRLTAVHTIYADSFKSADELGDAGNLVFTGVSSDPETVKTLAAMGYREPERVCEIIMGWHHGQKRCTRTKRARELLTELMPSLLKRLADTANPDAAFLKFDEFLTHLPAAIQLFSLFQANKELLGLIADIMGSAPALADTLAKSSQLIESVLFEDFYKTLPTKEQLAEQARERIAHSEDNEEIIEYLTYFRNERQFQAGVQFLKHMIDAQELGHFLTHLAEVIIELTLATISKEFEKTYGRIAGGEFAVIALGKCGSYDLTFHSDLDLVFVYRVPDFDALSDGDKNYNASVYYNRFAQRFVSALSTLTRAGKLYDVDTRLRPSGKQGLLAVSDQALAHYFTELAWTFEYMAFTKARVIAGNKALSETLTQFIAQQIAKPRDVEKLRADVHDMRLRMAEQYTTDNIWDLKHIRGGLTDIDFIRQYMLLAHQPHANDILNEAWQFQNQLFHMLRLCVGGTMDEATALRGFKRLLKKTVNQPDFTTLKLTLEHHQADVYASYQKILVS